MGWAADQKACRAISATRLVWIRLPPVTTTCFTCIRFFPLAAKEAGRTLVQPRAGVPLISEHIKLLEHLQEEGEADLLPTTIDSYTRQNRYEEAENGIRESMRLNRAMLNGFPAVNHGVSGCRQIIESVHTPVQVRHGTPDARSFLEKMRSSAMALWYATDSSRSTSLPVGHWARTSWRSWASVHTPVQVRHGTPDARLLTEITYAGGFTSYEGGGISYNLPYCKNIPMERTIRDWQYVDRLTGLYEEMGVSINREPYGPLTGTLVPPCISHAAAIIEALLAGGWRPRPGPGCRTDRSQQ